MKKAVPKVEEMEVFKKSHKLTLEIYEITKRFPQEEKFSLISQMKRAAYSIPSNLMEGGYRFNRKEYKQFLSIAKGSAGELKYFLLLSKDLGYIVESDHLILSKMIDEISRMLSGLIKFLTVTDTNH